MFHKKYFVIFFLFLLFVSVSAIEIDVFPENETDSSISEVAKMRGELTVKIQNESQQTRDILVSKQEENKKELMDYIDKRTNPLILSIPTIAVLLLLASVWFILKSKEKI